MIYMSSEGRDWAEKRRELLIEKRRGAVEGFLEGEMWSSIAGSRSREKIIGR